MAETETPTWLEREYTFTRDFEAPIDLVFKMWTDPDHVRQWWGPQGFSNPVCDLDVRPGGNMTIHMRGANGVIYPMTGVYQDVVEPTRIVFASSPLDKAGNPLFEVLQTVTLEEDGPKTKLTLQAKVVSLTDKADPYLSGLKVGWTQTLERLYAYVSTANREILITRVINAPKALVFKAFTDPQHIGEWWGPNGFTLTTDTMAVKPGGVWRFVMHGPDGVDYPNKIVYLEIEEPERLVFSHGEDDTDAAEMFHVTVTFDALLDAMAEKTRVTMRSRFPTATERDKTVAFGAVEGGNQTLERLETYLTTAMKGQHS